VLIYNVINIVNSVINIIIKSSKRTIRINFIKLLCGSHILETIKFFNSKEYPTKIPFFIAI